MLLKGDKIQLVTTIEGFNKVGDVFDVVDILEGGTISFRCGYGVGIMSHNEFENYFKVVQIRKWGRWMPVVQDNKTYIYRTNGKKVELKADGIKTYASCAPNDTFDLRKGLDLCMARFKVKQILENM